MHLKIQLAKSKLLGGIRCIEASEKINKGEVIEICPVILLTREDMQHIPNTVLTKYEFNWDENREALCLGYGSLHNHAENPNVEFEQDYENEAIVFTAMRDIEPGEELFINYMQGSEEEIIPQEYLDYKH